MIALVRLKQADLAALCSRYRVRRLELFGSASRDDFDPARSDLDFLVEFQPMSPGDHADAYFGLLEALEALFARPVDLVELGPIDNPYLLASIEKSREVLYAA
jgi:predicted nucleotidyltransferase